MATTETETAVVVVTCACGFYPLDNATHRTSALAWQAAAAHVDLNPTKCQPVMSRSTAPTGVVARLPR